MKKTIYIIVSLIMMLASVLLFSSCERIKDLFSSGEDYVSSDGLLFTLSDDESYYIVAGMGNCTDTDIVIPLTYKEKPVKEIGEGSFKSNQNITSIKLHNEITVIGDKAFYYCGKLSRVVLGNGLNEIGDEAFYNCDKIESIFIPKSVTEIGDSAFLQCSKLERIDVDENNSAYKSVDGIFYNKSGSVLIQYPVGREEKNLTLPKGVREIQKEAFNLCKNINKVELPIGVETIGDSAFEGCENLEHINLPTTLIHIGDRAFSSCSGLTEIIIPDGVTKIGARCFIECSSLTNLKLPANLVTIGQYAFYKCSSISEIVVPDTVKDIGDDAFGYCTSLESILICTTVKTIGDGAFFNCDQAFLYVDGNESAWEKIKSENSFYDISNYKTYIYSASRPLVNGNYWHYVEGEIVVW